MFLAIVSPKHAKHGLFPLGGVVDDVDQTSSFRDIKNELKGGSKVTISEQKDAVVTTFGGGFDKARVTVVKVQGTNGWYLASAFERAEN